MVSVKNQPQDPGSVITENVSNDGTLIIYPWAEGNPTQQRSEGLLSINLSTREPVAINLGIINVGFTRSKAVGSMEVVYAGYADKDVIRKGNWVVYKTSSSGRIVDPLRDGIVRFIGQIFAINPNYTKDASGKFTSTYKISVREWSHLLYCPVRYDPYVNAGQSQASVVQNITKDAYPNGRSNPLHTPFLNNQNQYLMPGQNQEQFSMVPINIPPNENKITEPLDAATITQELFVRNRQPFTYVSAILSLISNMNKAVDSLASVFNQQDSEALISSLNNHYKTVSRSAAIPARLVKDHVYTSSEANSFDPVSPLSTGFMWYVSGIQKWDQNKSVYNPDTGLYDLSKFKGANMADLVYSQTEAFRPGTLIDPKIVMNGITAIEAISSMCEPAAYDFYTDMWYTEVDGVIKCAPVLVVRDRPFSIKSYRKLFTQTNNSKYKWTMFDDLPQLTIRASSIQGINQSTNMLDSVNYVRVIPNTNGIMDQSTQSTATFQGTAIIPSQQYRFGGKEMLVDTYCGVITPGENDGLPTYDTEWFAELRNRIVEWYSNSHLWSKMTITMKDSNYPLSIGDNIRIPLGTGRPILIGHLEAIDYRMKCEESGLITNQVYLTISRVGMQDPTGGKKDYNGNVVPLPEGAAVMLHRITDDEPSALNLMVQPESPNR